MAERVERMARRLARDARRHGVSAPDADALVAAFRLAMRSRSGFDDDHHPDVLHTARTALILLEDAGVRDRDGLCAAAVCETRDWSLAPSRDLVAVELGDGVVLLLDAVPLAGGPDERLEALVVAPEGAALVALAERLDHARHLHLRDREEWRAYHAMTCGAYLAAAGRLSPGLAHRFAWWCETFRSRFLGPP